MMDDAREAELRMANLIIRDLPEPVTNDTDQIRSAEILEIKKIFDTCEVQIQDADIISIERIGDKDNKPNNRARLLKVKLRDANLKRPLFRNLHKFREYQLNLQREGDDGQGPDQIPLVSVDHDMTLAQREYKKALIAKAIPLGPLSTNIPLLSRLKVIFCPQQGPISKYIQIIRKKPAEYGILQSFWHKSAIF